MRGNYEPTRAPLRSAFDLFFLLAPGPCLPCSLVVSSSTSTIKDVSSSHFLLFATKSEEKGSFHVFNKALCWISTSQKRAKLWRSVKYDAHLFRIKISQLWGLRSDIAQNVTPSQRNQIRPFHPVSILSVQCILAQISLYVLHPAHISSSTAFTSKTKQCPSMQTISDHEQCMYIHNTHSRAICVRRTWMGPTT